MVKYPEHVGFNHETHDFTEDEGLRNWISWDLRDYSLADYWMKLDGISGNGHQSVFIGIYIYIYRRTES